MAQLQESSALLNTHELAFSASPRVAIVQAEWNDRIVRELANGCLGIIHKFNGEVTDHLSVPGCFELPFACRKLWEHCAGRESKPEAIIAFGAVIRGGTPHFEYVSKAVTDGIVQLNLVLPVPVIFGVLTLDSEAQAWERLGGAHGHKGEEAAITALKMIRLARALK